MALPQVVTIGASGWAGLLPVQTSAGSGSAGSIPALNSDGQIDSTMLPAPSLSPSVADGVYTLASLTVNGSVITAVSSGAITSGNVTTALGFTPVNNANAYTWAAEQTFSAAITVPDATVDANPMTYGQGVTFLTGGSLSPAFNMVTCTALEALNSTTLAGTTSGQIIYDMPLQGSAKKLTIVADNYENDTSTSQSFTFPLAFTYQPAITFNESGLTLTASTTELTITAPNATTVYNGVIIVEGI